MFLDKSDDKTKTIKNWLKLAMQKRAKKEKRLIRPKSGTWDQFETSVNKATGTKNGTENWQKNKRMFPNAKITHFSFLH